MEAYQRTPHNDLVLAVIHEVASRENIAPERLPPLLYNAIDPDSLNELFANRGDKDVHPNERVVFRYHGYEVTAYADGRVEVEGAQNEHGVPSG